MSFRVALLACAGLMALGRPAAADTIEDFYKGKTLTFIVGNGAGGVYDLYARTIAKFLPGHLPGKPNVIVQNVPGSGSVQAVNRVYNDAPQDGTVLAGVSNAAPFLPLLGLKQARFDPEKIFWLGSPTAENSAFFVWHTVPVNSLDDLKTHEVIVGANGPNASPAFYAKALNSVFHTKIKTVYGYVGVPDTMLAMERGEVSGYAGIFWNQLKTSYGQLLRDKKLKFLVQFGTSANPEMPGVPLVSDLITSPDDKRLFAAVTASLSIGYPYLMGPGVPKERVAAMRKAFQETLRDPAFQSEAKKQNLAVAPLSGEEVEKIVRDAYAISPQLRTRLRALYNGE